MTKKATHEQDLTELCAYAFTLYTKDKSQLSGTLFALLAKKLLASEIQPGGPYKDATGKATVKVNIAVAKLFTLMGTPLPNVDLFLQNYNAATLNAADRKALDAYKNIWPHAADTQPATLSEPYLRAQATLSKMSEPLRSQALHFLERVAQADTTKEIAHIAAFANASLGSDIKKDTLMALGEANIYGWIAYTIYDHIIDGESSAALLPVANVTMRLSLMSYKKMIPQDNLFQKTIDQLFNDIDEANAWELETCRFRVRRGIIRLSSLPHYQQNEVLARRSGIHILGPLIAVHSSPLGKDARKMKYLHDGLQQYLIARQLSDDIHDWKEDLAAGHVTAVVAQLLADNTHTAKRIHVKALTAALQHSFLQHSMYTICQCIIHHATLAKYNLRLADCTGGPLYELVARIEQMAKQSLTERSRFLDFRTAYVPPTPTEGHSTNIARSSQYDDGATQGTTNRPRRR